MTVAGLHERVEAWEQAYRDYAAAWEHGTRVFSPAASLNTSNAARRVAWAWHELAQTRGLPWWCGGVGFRGRRILRSGKGLGE